MTPGANGLCSIGLGLFGLLSACAAPDVQDSQIRIVPGYEGMAEYVAAAGNADREQKDALFDRYVYQPYKEPCAGAGDLEYSDSLLRATIFDVSELGKVLNEIERVDVVARINRAVEQAMAKLPIDSLTVCVFAHPPNGKNAEFVREVMGGSFGFMETSGVIWVQLLPTDGWSDEIFATVAHEYYHAANYPFDPSAPGATTLLDILINEGGAESFVALLLAADFVPKWSTPLTRDQQAEVWEELKRKLDSTDEAVIEKYIIGGDDGVPFQAGYIIGFEIVQAYLASHPDQPPEFWSRLSPREILTGSGYESKLKAKTHE